MNALRADTRIDGFEVLPIPIMALSSRFHIVYVNPAWLEMVGLKRASVTGRYLFDVFPETTETMETLKRSFRDVLKGQTIELKAIPYRLDSNLATDTRSLKKLPLRYWTNTNSPLWLEGRTRPLILQTSREVSREVAMMEQSSLLRDELQHRLRNTVSLSLGVLRTRARSHTEIGALVKDVTERLRAISSQQDALMPKNEYSNGLKDILERELFPFAARDKISLSGPNLSFSEDVSVTVSMLVHELVSNAVKHGSFSRKNGHLECFWHIEGEKLFFQWNESGVSCSKPKESKGFGSNLLARLPGVEAKLVFEKNGLKLSAIIEL